MDFLKSQGVGQKHYVRFGLDLTYFLSWEHMPQTIPVHLALSCAAASIFLQLYLYLSCRTAPRFIFPALSSKCYLAASSTALWCPL